MIPVDARGQYPADGRQPIRPKIRIAVLSIVAILSALVLVLTVSDQIFDANHYALTEATAILAGDRPYVDFFETGIPLAAYMAAGVQLLSGRVLLGEFIRQWSFIVAGVVISFHLALRLSRSVAATMLVLPLVLVVLAGTPTYHYSKLFFFPLGLWAGWRYVEQPGVWRGIALAVIAATGFLFRHDYGVYLGFGSVAAYGLARAAVPASRNVRSLAADAAAYAATLAVLLGPWVAVVQRHGGLGEYTQRQAELFQSPKGSVYASLLHLNPLQTLAVNRPQAPQPGPVAFEWVNVDDGQRQALERQFGLVATAPKDASGRWHYRVPDLYDTSLLDLNRHINDTQGFDWQRLKELRWHLPTMDNAALWMQQVALLVPLLLLLTAALEARRSRAAGGVTIETWLLVYAALLLAVIDSALLRQTTYVVVVAPVTAALSTRLLAARRTVTRLTAVIVLALTTFVGYAWARNTPLFAPRATLIHSVAAAMSQLTASPPDYNFAPYRYLHDCTAAGDHILITGTSPLHVSYYAQRPLAGGHINWHRGWRSNPADEAESLALLQRQSVPFAISSTDPVLTELKSYPHIRAYLGQNYVEVAGDPKLLVDRRRQPTGTWGPMDWPCFR